MNEELNTIKNICRYCLSNFQIRDSSRLMSSLVYQLCRELDIDAPAAEGIMYVEVNGFRRPYAHCFNLYKGDIVDSTIYGFALLNKSIEHLFPIFIAGTPPDHMDYAVHKEIKYSNQRIFNKEFLDSIILKLPDYSKLDIKRFSDLEDAKKESLFWCETAP